MGHCLCSRRCRKLQDACPFRSEPVTWSMKKGDAAFCWAVFLESRRQRSPSLAAELSASTQPKLLSAWARIRRFDINLNRLRELDDIFNGRVRTLASNSYTIARSCEQADLVIGGVLIPGAAAPKLVTREMVSHMKRGAVIVDVAIDQGGCIETAKPTTHSNPAYTVDGVVHYCVTNMPGAVPHTSTLALTNATFPYVLKLANMGAQAAIKSDPGIREGVNTFEGHLTYSAVAESQKKQWKPVKDLVA